MPSTVRLDGKELPTAIRRHDDTKNWLETIEKCMSYRALSSDYGSAHDRFREAAAAIGARLGVYPFSSTAESKC